jgi:gamma-glutamylcyclotransferase (GGCT)/AIG2-like uncharacterized protein YtfP
VVPRICAGDARGRRLGRPGYPALVLDPDAAPVEVQVFESADLPVHWSRLDHLEGSGYRRVPTTVSTTTGQIDALIYVLRSEPVTS